MCLSVCLCVCVSVSVCLSVCVCVCLSPDTEPCVADWAQSMNELSPYLPLSLSATQTLCRPQSVSGCNKLFPLLLLLPLTMLQYLFYAALLADITPGTQITLVHRGSFEAPNHWPINKPSLYTDQCTMHIQEKKSFPKTDQLVTWNCTQGT